jgi:hypothetical protein
MYISPIGISTMYSKLHLVDLAGSEKAKKTGAEGDRFKEGDRNMIILMSKQQILAMYINTYIMYLYTYATYI